MRNSIKNYGPFAYPQLCGFGEAHASKDPFDAKLGEINSIISRNDQNVLNLDRDVNS
jgi:hypothetical protein